MVSENRTGASRSRQARAVGWNRRKTWYGNGLASPVTSYREPALKKKHFHRSILIWFCLQPKNVPYNFNTYSLHAEKKNSSHLRLALIWFSLYHVKFELVSRGKKTHVSGTFKFPSSVQLPSLASILKFSKIYNENFML